MKQSGYEKLNSLKKKNNSTKIIFRPYVYSYHLFHVGEVHSIYFVKILFFQLCCQIYVCIVNHCILLSFDIYGAPRDVFYFIPDTCYWCLPHHYRVGSKVPFFPLELCGYNPVGKDCRATVLKRPPLTDWECLCYFSTVMHVLLGFLWHHSSGKEERGLAITSWDWKSRFLTRSPMASWNEEETLL